ncbi:hypothetical protein GGS20DRAFT_102232 [Poronia punctata]|nr:hypothetical protein GGS20DRAFT_102232 [Poronia punctata]
MSSTRRRKPFSLPPSSDDEEEEEGPAYDEQEQEEIIHLLTRQNATRNAQFRIFLLFLPLLSAIPYILLLFKNTNANTNEKGKGTGMALLALTSLACTTWTLWFLPPGETGLDGRGRKEGGREKERGKSPLERYLPFLNAALCAVLVLTGLFSKSQRLVAALHWGHVGLANLPAVVYGVVVVAKMLMGSVDPERELSALRYEYKGA